MIAGRVSAASHVQLGVLKVGDEDEDKDGVEVEHGNVEDRVDPVPRVAIPDDAMMRTSSSHTTRQNVTKRDKS